MVMQCLLLPVTVWLAVTQQKFTGIDWGYVMQWVANNMIGHPPFSSIFLDFRDLRREQRALFFTVECKIRIFADFRQNHLFSAGDQNTISKTTVSTTLK